MLRLGSNCRCYIHHFAGQVHVSMLTYGFLHPPVRLQRVLICLCNGFMPVPVSVPVSVPVPVSVFVSVSVSLWVCYHYYPSSFFAPNRWLGRQCVFVSWKPRFRASRLHISEVWGAVCFPPAPTAPPHPCLQGCKRCRATCDVLYRDHLAVGLAG